MYNIWNKPFFTDPETSMLGVVVSLLGADGFINNDGESFKAEEPLLT